MSNEKHLENKEDQDRIEKHDRNSQEEPENHETILPEKVN